MNGLAKDIAQQMVLLIALFSIQRDQSFASSLGFSVLVGQGGLGFQLGDTHSSGLQPVCQGGG